jgi:hypothetical protein
MTKIGYPYTSEARDRRKVKVGKQNHQFSKRNYSENL